MKEKADEEHNLALERINNVNMLKKQEDDYNQMKNNTKNMKKMKNSLLLSESAKSIQEEKNKTSLEQIKQFENLEKTMNKQMQQVSMNKELENLANINKMIATNKKKNEREIIAKKIESSSDSESESNSDKNESETVSTTTSKSKSRSTTKSSKKYQEDSVSVASSNSYILKRPDLTKMLGKKEDSIVKQIEIVSKESAIENSAKKYKKK
jgi:hypothetical protein